MPAQPVVQSIGNLFVDRVTEKAPKNPASLKAEFTEFCSALDTDLREPLAEFVTDRLSANPDTAWMAAIISSNDVAKNKAYAVLEDIKTNNAALHDKSVRKGGFIGFGCNGKSIELAEVLRRIEAGDTVTMTVAKYEKASGWAIAGAICLGGSWPTLDDVNLKSLEIKKDKLEASSFAELESAWKNAKLMV